MSGRPKLSIEHYTKQCEVCDDYYAKPSTTPWGRWNRRRFCSLECWWKTRPNWNRYAIKSEKGTV